MYTYPRASLALLVLVIGHSKLQCYYVNANTVRYMVTIDAGSTGSRVHVHRFSEKQKYGRRSAVPNILGGSSSKIKPGLSSFARDDGEIDTAGLKEHVDSMVDYAIKHVPSRSMRSTPVFLKATAGLRNLPDKQAAQIIRQCRETLGIYSFAFKPEWVDVISGTDEGKFGWIAVNYLEGRFDDGADGPTSGVVEMGGASLQVSFVPEEVTDPDEDDRYVTVDGKIAKSYVTVDVGRPYRLFTHSYLDYGLERAQELFHQRHPEEEAACYPRGYPLDGREAAGDYARCGAAVDLLLGGAGPPCDRDAAGAPPCPLGGIPVPSAAGVSFVGIENFFYTPEFFGVPDDPAALAALAAEFCATPWEESARAHPEEGENLPRYCFAAAFEDAVLRRGLGIGAEQVRIARTIGGTNIDWAVGSVVYEFIHNYVPNQDPMVGSSDRTPLGKFGDILWGSMAVFLVVRIYTSRKYRFMKAFSRVPAACVRSV